jgi:hypothetical protein
MLEPTCTIAPDAPHGFLHITFAGDRTAEITARFWVWSDSAGKQ